VTTNSFEPTQAAIAEIGTSTANRRSIHLAAADRSASDPIDGGYPRSAPEVASAATTEAAGGSKGVPIERSMTPPENRSA